MPKLPELHLKTARQIAVRLTGVPQAHPTSGYRQWVGSVEAADPIVALVIIVSGNEVSWTRSTHQASTSLETRFLFSPFDSDGHDVQVAFAISDAIAYGRSILESALIHPAPEVGEYVTGHVVDIVRIQGKPICELKALFMLRWDVKSVSYLIKCQSHRREQMKAKLRNFLFVTSIEVNRRLLGQSFTYSYW